MTGLTLHLEMPQDAGMYYMYILRMNNNQIYIGFTKDLKARISLHQGGKVYATKKYLPIKLVYYECYLARNDAKLREARIKHYGSTYSQLKKRISHSIKASQERG